MNEYEMLHQWLDAEADNFVSVTEHLHQLGLTMDEALEEADAYRERFFCLLKKYDIPQDNISGMINRLYILLEDMQNDELIFLYTALATERCLLFGEIKNDRHKVWCWLEQKANADTFSHAIRMEKEYQERMEKLASIPESSASGEPEPEEQAGLYQMALEHDFLYKSGKNNVFLENIGEMVQKVNAVPELKAVKPYVYSTVLCRKQTYMTGRRGFTPHLANVFQYYDYQIKHDNGKNFDTYQSYVELYDQLRRVYEDEADIDFSDYCFAHLSNLSEWYYRNCQPNEPVPMTLKRMAEQMTTRILLGNVQIDEEHPVLEIAYQNVLANEREWLDFIHAVQKGAKITDYCERLYKEAGGARMCRNKKLALQYAELFLNTFMEEMNRRLLVDAVRNFL